MSFVMSVLRRDLRTPAWYDERKEAINAYLEAVIRLETLNRRDQLANRKAI